MSLRWNSSSLFHPGKFRFQLLFFSNNYGTGFRIKALSSSDFSYRLLGRITGWSHSEIFTKEVTK
jgi:hypothetical protein